MLSYTTAGIAARYQLEAWERVVVDLHGKTRFERPCAQGYRGVLAARQVEKAQFVTFDADPACSTRTAAQISADAVSRYELMLVLGGECELLHCGNRTRVKRDDCVLVDMAQPHWMLYREPLSAVLIACDRSVLEGKLPGVNQSSGQLLPGDSAVSAAITSYAQTASCNLGRWQQQEFRYVMAHLLDLIALLLDGQHDLRGSARVTQVAMLHRLKQFIHANLSDEVLTLADVAAANGISLRYMQKLFQTAGIAPREYLLDARLLRARAFLRQNRSKHSVSSIAYMTGFRSISYFSAAYKRRFGCSPRDDARG